MQDYFAFTYIKFILLVPGAWCLWRSEQCCRFSKTELLRDVSYHVGARNHMWVLWKSSRCSKPLSLLWSPSCLSAQLVQALIRQVLRNNSMKRQSCSVGKTLRCNGDRSRRTLIAFRKLFCYFFGVFSTNVLENFSSYKYLFGWSFPSSE